MRDTKHDRGQPDEKNPFAIFSFDGVLGLGFASLSVDPSFSFIQQVMDSEPAMLRLLSVYLGKNEYDNKIMLGGYDRSRAANDMQWAKITDPEHGYWQVSVRSFLINNVAFSYCDDGTCRAVADLGSTLFSVPTPLMPIVAKSFFRFVPGPDFNCRSGDNTMSLELDGFTLTFPEAEIMRESPQLRHSKNGTKMYVCLCKVDGVTLPPPLGPKIFILGHPVLRTYYTAYDWEQRRIGFATPKELTVSSEPHYQSQSRPVYIRSLTSTDYYIPHVTGQEVEMEQKLQAFGLTTDL